MDQIVPRILRFDRFALDLTRGCVRIGGEDIDLRPKPFEVLRYLAENAGRLVPKQELFEAVWPDVTVTDDSLVQCIRELRSKLGDDSHRVIKTVPRRGYILDVPVLSHDLNAERASSATRTGTGAEVLPTGKVAPSKHDTTLSVDVKEPLKSPDDHHGAALDTAVPIAPSDSSAAGRRSRALVAAIVLVALFLGSGWVLRGWPTDQGSARLTMMAAPSIAVLPIKTLGDDTDNDLAALADEVVRELWNTPLGFEFDIRRTNASKDSLADPKGIGRDLGVRYILSSGARREGDLMHINVQLIEVESARQAWVASFDYRLGEPGALNRTAARISRMLSAELLQVEVRRPLPAQPEAAHFTMLGRSLMNNERSAKTNGEAIALFEKALAIDPEYFFALVNYARATAGHILNLWAPQNEHAEWLAKAEAAIKLAIKLKPNSAGAHLTHGGVLRARGDHKQAIAAFRQALMFSPNFANAHAELGRTMIDVGSANEAIGHIEKAIAISPTDSVRYMWCYWAGLASLHVGDHGAALDWLRRSYQANRAYDNTLRLMAIAHAYAGEETEARAKMNEFLELRPGFTLSGSKQANSSRHPLVAVQRARMLATMKWLGVPAGKL